MFPAFSNVPCPINLLNRQYTFRAVHCVRLCWRQKRKNKTREVRLLPNPARHSRTNPASLVPRQDEYKVRSRTDTCLPSRTGVLRQFDPSASNLQAARRSKTDAGRRLNPAFPPDCIAFPLFDSRGVPIHNALWFYSSGASHASMATGGTRPSGASTRRRASRARRSMASRVPRTAVTTPTHTRFTQGL